MYEMLTGQLPYTGDTLSEIALKHLEAKPLPPHDIVQDFPPQLEGIILKAMDPNADERYQSAAELLDALEEFTEGQSEEAETEEKIPEEVVPVRSVSEMSRGSFLLRKKRAGRVSFFSGAFLILAIAVFLFAGLWNFWLKEIFPDSGTVVIPEFVGSNIADISNNTDYTGVYNFLVSYVPSSAADAGIVISQTPAGGRSVAAQSAGININLTVNAGAVFEEIPDVIGSYYRDALRTLEALGFVVEIENEVSETVEEDYATDISPSPGDRAVNGSTVYLTVSAGRELTVVSMPLLIGLTEDAAVSKINAANLTCGGTEFVISDTEKGIVLSQSVEAFSEIEEHAKVVITVSAGQEG
jgi:serine/threonine-protein kinase